MDFSHPLARGAKVWTAQLADGGTRRILVIVTNAVLVLTPVLVTIFFAIHRHYHNVASHLTLVGYGGLPDRSTRHRVIVPISGVHQGTLEGLHYARLLSDDVTAVHVSIDPEETEKVQPHLDVILNRKSVWPDGSVTDWTGYKWQALGAYVGYGWACAWFGVSPDAG